MAAAGRRSAGADAMSFWRLLQTTFVLFESASGFSLFEVKEFDEIGQSLDKVQQAVRCDACIACSLPLPLWAYTGSCFAAGVIAMCLASARLQS